MNNKKKLASAVIALVLTASAATAAYAADYAQEPDYKPDYSSSSSVTNQQIQDAINNASNSSGGISTLNASATGTSGGSSAGGAAAKEDTSAQNTESIESAIGAGSTDAAASVKVTSSKNLVIRSSMVKKLADEGVDLVIASPKATLTVDAKSIEKVSKLNLSMSVTNTKTQTKINFTSKKEFGCSVKVELTACKMPEKKLKKANVYLNGKKIGPVEFTEDGVPYFVATAGGTYTIK